MAAAAAATTTGVGPPPGGARERDSSSPSPPPDLSAEAAAVGVADSADREDDRGGPLYAEAFASLSFAVSGGETEENNPKKNDKDDAPSPPPPSSSSSPPKRPASAFLRFFHDVRRSIRLGDPDVSNAEASKRAGEMWRNLSVDDRRRLESAATKEIDEWKSKFGGGDAAPRRKRGGKRSEGDGAGGGGTERRKKRGRPPKKNKKRKGGGGGGGEEGEGGAEEREGSKKEKKWLKLEWKEEEDDWNNCRKKKNEEEDDDEEGRRRKERLLLRGGAHGDRVIDVDVAEERPRPRRGRRTDSDGRGGDDDDAGKTASSPPLPSPEPRRPAASPPPTSSVPPAGSTPSSAFVPALLSSSSTVAIEPFLPLFRDDEASPFLASLYEVRMNLVRERQPIAAAVVEARVALEAAVLRRNDAAGVLARRTADARRLEELETKERAKQRSGRNDDGKKNVRRSTSGPPPPAVVAAESALDRGSSRRPEKGSVGSAGEEKEEDAASEEADRRAGEDDQSPDDAIRAPKLPAFVLPPAGDGSPGAVTTTTSKAATPSRGKATWKGRYEELKKYKEEHGDCEVPLFGTAGKRAGALGHWVANQRRLYRKLQQGLERTSLTPERVELLNDIGFAWTGRKGRRTRKTSEEEATTTSPSPSETAKKRRDPPRAEGSGNYVPSWKERQWVSNFEELKKYREEHGNFQIPMKTKLGQWAKYQRKSYRYTLTDPTNRRAMTPERVKLFGDIGFWSEWNMDVDGENGPKRVVRRRNQDRWLARVEEIKRYKEEHGDYRPPSNSKLGQWAKEQRKFYRRTMREPTWEKAMPPERVRILEEIGFMTCPPARKKRPSSVGEEDGEGGRPSFDRDRSWCDRQWLKRFEELKEYKARYGHLYVPVRNKDGRHPLNRWITDQRTVYRFMQKGCLEEKKRTNAMTPQKAKMLEDLGFEWVSPRLANQASDDYEP